MSDDLPPGVVRLPQRSRDRGETRRRGTVSRHRFADETGRCVHPPQDAGKFCHVPTKQPPFGPCHRPAGWATAHPGSGPCKHHGGRLPNVSQHHEEVLLVERARRELTQLNAAAGRIDNPLAALAELAGEATRWKNILAAHVSTLEHLRYSSEGEDGQRTEHIRGEVILFQNALKDLGHLLVAIARLNIDDRLARIEERELDMVVRAVDAGLIEAGVKPHDMDRVRSKVGAVLRRLSA